MTNQPHMSMPCPSGTRNEVLVEQGRLQQLRCDFEYNLELLKQRDEELSRYDTAFTEIKKVVNSLVAENSELKVSEERCVVYELLAEENGVH